MRTALEKLTDKAPTEKQKSVRRIEEAGIIRSPEASSKIATARLRTAIAELTDANLSEMQFLIDYVSLDDPKGALDILIRLLEFSVPKLSRVEAVAVDGGGTGLRDLTIGDLQSMLQAARTHEGESQSEDAEDAEYSDLI